MTNRNRKTRKQINTKSGNVTVTPVFREKIDIDKLGQAIFMLALKPLKNRSSGQT